MPNVNACVPPIASTDAQRYLKVPKRSLSSATLLTKSYQLWQTPIVIETTDLKIIKLPVLVMAGDDDFSSIEDNVEIYRSLPRAQLVILPGTGHGTFLERPELANLATREFLERPESDKGAR